MQPYPTHRGCSAALKVCTRYNKTMWLRVWRLCDVGNIWRCFLCRVCMWSLYTLSSFFLFCRKEVLDIRVPLSSTFYYLGDKRCSLSLGTAEISVTFLLCYSYEIQKEPLFKHSLNLNQSKSTDYQWNLTDSNS